MVKVAAMDPGISTPGFAVVTRGPSSYQCPYRVLDSDSMHTTPEDGDLAERCSVIWDALSLLLRVHTPDLLAIEEQANTSAGAWREGRFSADNSKTHVTVGLAIGCARAYRVPVMLIRPQTVKVAVCGKGGANAKKQQVQEAVFRLTGQRVAQARADAIAIGIAGAQRWQLEKNRRTA